jgi:hypothetical protein
MLHLTSCDCPGNQRARIHRAQWMRVLAPARRLYECPHCGRLFLVRPDSSRFEQRLPLFVLGLLAVAGAAAGSTLWSSGGARPLAVAAPAEAHAAAREQCTRIHVVHEGETLQAIADMELGDPEKWQQIRIANQQRLDAYDTGLADGTRLVIPLPCIK